MEERNYSCEERLKEFDKVKQEGFNFLSNLIKQKDNGNFEASMSVFFSPPSIYISVEKNNLPKESEIDIETKVEKRIEEIDVAGGGIKVGVETPTDTLTGKKEKLKKRKEKRELSGPKSVPVDVERL